MSQLSKSISTDVAFKVGDADWYVLVIPLLLSRQSLEPICTKSWRTSSWDKSQRTPIKVLLAYENYRAPLSFFATTDTGVTINRLVITPLYKTTLTLRRFSQDMSLLDIGLSPGAFLTLFGD